MHRLLKGNEHSEPRAGRDEHCCALSLELQNLLLVFPGMAMFYFDLHDSDGELRDDEGIDRHDLATARRLAIEALGQIIIDNGFKDQYGLKSVKIRDARGEVLQVSANVRVAH